MPSPASLSPFISNYIEEFLLGIHNKTQRLEHILSGLFSVVTPEEIIEKASLLYNKSTYQSLDKRRIIQNVTFLLKQFISIYSPCGLAPFRFKKDKLSRSFFQGIGQDLSDFREQVAQAEKEEAIYQSLILTLSFNSFSIDQFIKEDLKGKISDDVVVVNAQKLAHDFRNRVILSLLNIRPQDVYRLKDDKTDNTIFSQSLGESQKIADIIVYDLLWNASSVSHRCNIAQFYLETLKCCLADHDYHSAIAIYTALSSSDIERLEYLEIFRPELEKISDLFSLVGGFSALRNKVKKLQEESLNKKSVCKAIPYLGLYTQRLMYIKGMYIKGGDDEIEKLNKIGEIWSEVKCHQSHLRQLVSQRGLHCDFLERESEIDADEKYARSQLLKEEWTNLNKIDKKRARKGTLYPASEISVKKGCKTSCLKRLKDIFSFSDPPPEQHFFMQQYYLPVCVSRTSDYSEGTLEKNAASPYKRGKMPKP